MSTCMAHLKAIYGAVRTSKDGQEGRGREKRKGGKEKKKLREGKEKERKEEKKKEEKEGVSSSEQTRMEKNPELRYKRYVSSYFGYFKLRAHVMA